MEQLAKEPLAYEDGFIPTKAEDVRLNQTAASEKALDSLLNMEGTGVDSLKRAIFLEMTSPDDVDSAETFLDVNALLVEFTEADENRRKELVKEIVEKMRL